MSTRFTLLAFAALAGVAGTPLIAHAQTEVAPPAGDSGPCTISCGCTMTMCGCSRTGGSGGACKTDGNTCAVFACPGSMLPRGAALAVAVDGSVVTIHPPDEPAGAAELTTVRAVRWRTLRRGHAVGLDCGGAAVAEYFDVATAAALRNRSRELRI